MFLPYRRRKTPTSRLHPSLHLCPLRLPLEIARSQRAHNPDLEIFRSRPSQHCWQIWKSSAAGLLTLLASSDHRHLCKCSRHISRGFPAVTFLNYLEISIGFAGLSQHCWRTPTVATCANAAGASLLVILNLFSLTSLFRDINRVAF